MNKLIIFGANFFDLLKLVDAINRDKPTWEVLGYLDDTPEKQGVSYLNYPVLGTREKLAEYSKYDDVFIFSNVCGHWTRSRAVAALLDEHHARIPNLIHPMIDMSYVAIGRGCILPEGCVVGSQTVLGDFVTVRLGTVISHDIKIESHVFIGPGVTIGSGAILEEGAFVGAGATIMQNRRIGHGAMVGAGSLITRDVNTDTTVAGVPARELKRDSEK